MQLGTLVRLVAHLKSALGSRDTLLSTGALPPAQVQAEEAALEAEAAALEAEARDREVA